MGSARSGKTTLLHQVKECLPYGIAFFDMVDMLYYQEWVKLKSYLKIQCRPAGYRCVMATQNRKFAAKLMKKYDCSIIDLDLL